MHRLRATVVRVLNLFRRNRVEEDLHAQVEAHVRMLEGEFLRQGLSSSDALRASKRAMGNGALTREQMREERFFGGLDALARDVQLALRRLSKRPAITLVSVLALASGIGAAAATWSLLSAVLLRPLPVGDAEQLFVVGTRSVRPDGTVHVSDAHIYTMYPRVRETGVFDALAAGGIWDVLLDVGDRPVPGAAYFASHDFFDTLRVRPAIGREFTPDDDREGAPPVAMLSHSYWRRIFGADPNAIGREIRVGGNPVTIVGVAPRGFRGLSLSDAPDVYLPLHTVGDIMRGTAPSTNFFALPLNTEGTVSSPTAWIRLIGRMPPGLTADQARNRLDALWSEAVENGQTYRLTNLNTAAIPEGVRDGMGQFTRLLGLTVGLLLLIGCLAVGMLLLMRTEARRDELAMCLALGASRGRLARSVAVEGGLLALGGTLLALPIAQWFLWGTRAFELPGGVRVDWLELSLGIDAVAAAASGAVTSTFLIVLIAVSGGWSVDLAHALTSHTGATMPRTRAILVVGQVAVALVLLAGTGLFARSIIAALSLNPGYDTGRIVTGSVGLAAYGYSREEAAVFFDELHQRLSGNPAFASVSVVLPYGGMTTSGEMRIDGVPRGFPSFVRYTGIDERYFSTIGLPVIEGRDVSEYDGPDAPRVAIVSESLGRLLRNGNSPLGIRITEGVWRPPDPPDIIEVVGVVPDIVTNVTLPEPLVIYMPIPQLEATQSREIVLRARADTGAAVGEAMSAIRALDDAVTPQPMLTIDQRLGDQMSQQRFGVVVMGGLGMIALLLTILGIYVMAASTASGRRRELAIRAALGATGWRLGSTILMETTQLVGLGILLGFGLAWLGANTIRAFLYGIEPFDPLTLVGVSALILLLAISISLKPALAAMRLDVARTLRE